MRYVRAIYSNSSGLDGKENGGVTDCGCTAVILRTSILLGCYALCSLFASYYVVKWEETLVFSFVFHNGSFGLRCRKDIFVLGGLHLEFVHGLASLGNIDLVIALHNRELLSLSPEEKPFRRKRFSFRNHSFAREEKNMIVSFRKRKQKMETSW